MYKLTPLALGFVAAATHLGMGHGELLREPRTLISQDGVLEVGLKVQVGRVEGPFGISFNSRLYDGEFPGPSFRLSAGDYVSLELENMLEDNDAAFEADAKMNTRHAPNTTNFHTHGFHISPEGKQDNVMLYISPGDTFNYELDIHHLHNSGTSYYHPHMHGSSNMQLGGGMLGALIIEDDPSKTPDELLGMREHICILNSLYMDDLNDPAGNHDNGGSNRLPLDLQNPNGITGNILLVNGQHMPEIEAQPMEVQRLRMINGLARDNVYFGLKTGSGNDCKLWEVAKDGVYFEEIRSVDRVLIGSGSRADILVQCNATGDFALTTISDNFAKSLLDTWLPNNGMSETQDVLNIKVRASPSEADEKSSIVTSLPPYLPDFAPDYYLAKLRSQSSRLPRLEDVPTTTEIVYSDEQGSRSVNGKLFAPDFFEAYLELDKMYQWRVASGQPVRGDGTFPLHPHHQHAHHFLMMNTDTATNGLLWKKGEIRDTIPMYNHSDAIFRIIPADYIGDTMIHCHNVRHADEGMGSLFRVDRSSGLSTGEITAIAISAVVVTGAIAFTVYYCCRCKKELPQQDEDSKKLGQSSSNAPELV